MDPDPDSDPDPAPFVIDLQDANKKQIKNFFFAYYFLKVHFYIIFQRQKVKKKSQSSRNQGFSHYFCLLLAGSVSESIPLTNRSAIRIQEAQKHTDPQHWKKQGFFYSSVFGR